jgi:hypothetical protein
MSNPTSVATKGSIGRLSFIDTGNGARTYPTTPSSVNHNMSAKSDPRLGAVATTYLDQRRLNVRPFCPAVDVALRERSRVRLREQQRRARGG